MATLEKAISIAATAHDGQKDKVGQPYILHPLRVMQNVEGDEAKIVGILHDVVEDTNVTLEDLRRAGFSEAVLDAVNCVTHTDDESYVDYVIRCKFNPVARAVKLADLQDNAQLSRVLLRGDKMTKDLQRVKKYILSYKFLTDQLSEAEYRKQLESER